MIPDESVVATAAERIKNAQGALIRFDATPLQIAECIIEKALEGQELFGPDEAYAWIRDHRADVAKILAVGVVAGALHQSATGCIDGKIDVVQIGVIGSGTGEKLLSYPASTLDESERAALGAGAQEQDA